MPKETLLVGSGALAAGTRPRIRLDRYLESDTSDGVLVHYDLAPGPSWAGGNPINGAIVANLVNDGFAQPRPGDATAVVAAGQALPYVGGGVDFAAIGATGTYLRDPAASSAALWATPNQYFSSLLTLRLPSEADWNSEGIELPFLTHSNAGTGYKEGPDFVSLVQLVVGGNKVLRVYRQTALNTIDYFSLTLPPESPIFGAIVVVHMFRHATAQGAELYRCTAGYGTEAAVVTRTAFFSPGVNSNVKNALNFAAYPAMVGITGYRWGGRLADGRRNWRAYRHSLEALEISGRDPAIVAPAYAQRVFARGVFA